MNNPIILILFTFLRLSISSTDADPNPTGLTPVWKLPILNVSHRCDFDIVQAADIVDLEKFRNQYPRKNRPVLIKGATRHWPAFTLWTKKYIYRQLSEWKIPGHGTGIAGIINDDKWSKDIYSGDSSEGFEMDKSSVVKHPNAASPYIFSSLLKDGTIGKCLKNNFNFNKISIFNQLLTVSNFFILLFILSKTDAKGVSDFKPLDDTGDHVFSHWKNLKGSKIYNYFSLGGSDSGLSLHAHVRITFLKGFYFVSFQLDNTFNTCCH